MRPILWRLEAVLWQLLADAVLDVLCSRRLLALCRRCGLVDRGVELYRRAASTAMRCRRRAADWPWRI